MLLDIGSNIPSLPVGQVLQSGLEMADGELFLCKGNSPWMENGGNFTSFLTSRAEGSQGMWGCRDQIRHATIHRPVTKWDSSEHHGYLMLGLGLCDDEW